MAKKNSMVPMPSKGGVLPKLIGVVVVVALLAVVVKHPGDAAHWVHALIDCGEGVVNGLSAFFQQVSA